MRYHSALTSSLILIDLALSNLTPSFEGCRILLDRMTWLARLQTYL